MNDEERTVILVGKIIEIIFDPNETYNEDRKLLLNAMANIMAHIFNSSGNFTDPTCNKYTLNREFHNHIKAILEEIDRFNSPDKDILNELNKSN